MYKMGLRWRRLHLYCVFQLVFYKKLQVSNMHCLTQNIELSVAAAVSIIWVTCPDKTGKRSQKISGPLLWLLGQVEPFLTLGWGTNYHPIRSLFPLFKLLQKEAHNAMCARGSLCQAQQAWNQNVLFFCHVITFSDERLIQGLDSSNSVWKYLTHLISVY